MDAYMNEKEDRLNIDQLLGNLSNNDLVGANGIVDKNTLLALDEALINDIQFVRKPQVVCYI